MPCAKILDEYYVELLSSFPKDLQNIARKYDISFAEAKDHCYTIIKDLLIEELEQQEKSNKKEWAIFK